MRVRSGSLPFLRFSPTRGYPARDGHDRCVDADDPGPAPDQWPAAVPSPLYRAAGPGDAASLLALKKQLDRETSFMLLEPEKRTEDSADIAVDLSSMAGAASTTVVVAAETAGRLLGYAEARGGGFRVTGLPLTW